MFLRTLVVTFLIFFFFSCDSLSPNTTAKNNIQVLDTVIDYTSVDVYPLFSNCKDIVEKQAQKRCFENAITKKLSNHLNRINYNVRQEVNDSAYIHLLINNNGKTKVVSINSSQIIKNNLPELDSVIEASVNQLPIVKPALKRGIPIKSQYKLAIVIRTN